MLIGVPVANTTPRPPFCSCSQRVRMNMVVARWLCPDGMPLTRSMRVYIGKLLYWWLSSAISISTPRSSNVIARSFPLAFRVSSSIFSFLARASSSALTVRLFGFAFRPVCASCSASCAAFAARRAALTSPSSSRMYFSSISGDIFSLFN